MKKWQDKFVIGLTGNIGTGKSVVRRMLEHLGAYGIDADALAHRAMQKGAPAYEPVIEEFGRYILAADGEIAASEVSMWQLLSTLAQLPTMTVAEALLFWNNH